MTVMQPRSFKSTGEKHTRFYRTHIIKSEYDNLGTILVDVGMFFLSTDLTRKHTTYTEYNY